MGKAQTHLSRWLHNLEDGWMGRLLACCRKDVGLSWPAYGAGQTPRSNRQYTGGPAGHILAASDSSLVKELFILPL